MGFSYSKHKLIFWNCFNKKACCNSIRIFNTISRFEIPFMKNLLTVFILLILIWLCNCTGCKEQVKPGPVIKLCDTLKPISAAFRVGFYVDTGSGYGFIESDTVCSGPIVFRAKDLTGQTYQWWIGEETTPRTGKSISVYFQEEISGPLKVKLKVYRGGDTCFGPDKQVDSLTRYVQFISYRAAMSMFEGDYAAHIVESPNDTFTIHCYWTDQKVNEVDPLVGGSLWLEYYLPGCSKKHYMTLVTYPFYSVGDEQVGGRYAAGREYQLGILQPDCSNGASRKDGPYLILDPNNRWRLRIKWKIRRPSDSRDTDFQFTGLRR